MSVTFDYKKLKDGFALISKNEVWSTEYMMMGDKLKNFYYDRPGKARTPSWIKQAMYVISFYLDQRRTKRNANSEHQDFFMSTSTVRKALNKLSCHEYCMRTIEKNWNKLEKYGFIKIEKNPIKKSEAIDKLNYHYRIISINIEYINSLLSVYDIEDEIYKKLPHRNIIKKFIKARPISYVGVNNSVVISKFKEYKKQGLAKIYQNATDMVYNFASKVTKKYHSIHVLTKIYTPQFLIKDEETILARIESSPDNIIDLSDDDIMYLEKLKLDKKLELLEKEAKSMIKHAKIPVDHLDRYKKLGFIIANGNYLIVGFNPNYKPINYEPEADVDISSISSSKSPIVSFFEAIK